MKVGLTGGIGCGKSTVVELFRGAGWSTIETDAVARQLLESDLEIQSDLKARWGSGVFADDGTVDRKAVASRVFSDPAELAWLESMLHPGVRAYWEEAIGSRTPVNWLVEIPLLFEKSLETRFDFTVCVSCPPSVAARRMVARGYTGAQVEQRRERQMPLEDKVGRADFIISNGGSLEFLNRQTTRLIEQLGAPGAV